MATESAPVLSTPAEHILEEPTPIAVPTSESRISEEQLYIQYEIKRTIQEIRQGGWRRIALQFPDDMLVDAPRIYERLRDGLKVRAAEKTSANNSSQKPESTITESLKATHLDDSQGNGVAQSSTSDEVKLCILGDTSYGACCVDEVAAEHVDADVVVHYGRACLSPTARLPVIYVFTAKPLDLDAARSSFRETFPDKSEKVCLMADIPYSHHIEPLYQQLLEDGYTDVFATEIIRDPSSLLPNRTLPSEATQNSEVLKQHSIFHISSPPTSLLLILTSRVNKIYILPTDSPTPTTSALETSSAQTLRRRYALITRLSTVGIFGILINTLSVSNYMAALQHVQDLITRAGKKYYVFVVGKINPAKIANFAEIGGWVVIGCWESSLIESKEFFRPIITPFELEVALMDDNERVWGGEWVGDFSQLLGRDEWGRKEKAGEGSQLENDDTGGFGEAKDDVLEDEEEDEPPEFDLRTGRYVSHSRPMGRPRPSTASSAGASAGNARQKEPSFALVQRAVAGEVAMINGAASPGAEFLRSQRTWQGLGSDYEIAYERDEEGKIRGAVMEEGRSGIARGYTVGEDEDRS